MTKKLLMIDDDPDFVSGIRSILTAANFEVDVAYTPKDGLQSLQTKQYDLLLPVHPRFVEIDELVEKPVEPKLLLEKVNGLIQAAEAKKAGK
jgi:DNA-binding response OmpR family regulator